MTDSIPPAALLRWIWFAGAAPFFEDADEVLEVLAGINIRRQVIL